MFTISIPFPSKREQRRIKGKKKPAGGAKGGPAATAAAATAAAAAAKPRPRPAWNATVSDLSKHRLTAAEMEFRRALRQSRHRLPRPSSSQAGSETSSQQLPLRTPLEEGPAQEAQQWQAASEAAEAEVLPAGGLDHTGSLHLTDDELEQGSDGSSTASLAGMRAFVARLQAKYGLSGAAGAAGGKEVPAPTTAGGMLGAAPLPAQRKPSLAQLLEQELEKQAAELGCASEGEDDWPGGGGAGQHVAAELGGGAAGAAGAELPGAPQLDDGSDSEGGGRMGPAALRRAQRRQQQASLAAEAASGAGTTQPTPAGSQQALLARLAAAEAQLERFSGLEAALGRTQAEVQELRQQNAQLQTELNDFVAHTGTLISSLQLQLSSFLSGQGGSSSSGAADLAAAGRLQPPRQLSPASQVVAVPAAVVQARAAAEALAIAQQAHACSAAVAEVAADREATAEAGPTAAVPAEAAAPAASPPWEDALASVQLPSFRSFARLQGLAAAAGKPPPAPPAVAAPALDPRWSAGWAVDGGSAENSPPEPRALPRGLQQWRGSGATAGDGFEWRPMSAAS